MSTSRPVNADQLPVACTLGQDDGTTRMRRWQALAAAAHPTASREGRTLEVHFEHGPGVRAELVTLARAEQACCSFVTWTVTEDEGHPVLRVVAKPDSPDDVASIAALLVPPDYRAGTRGTQRACASQDDPLTGTEITRLPQLARHRSGGAA